MPAYATIPNALDDWSLTYSAENPLQLLKKFRALRDIDGLGALLDVKGVSLAVEFVPQAGNGIDIAASAEIKISIEIPDVLPGDGVGPQTIELAYSPSANIGAGGAWSVAVEQQILDLSETFKAAGTPEGNEVAFKIKAAGITTDTIAGMIPRLTTAALRVGATGDVEPMNAALEQLFRGIDHADFKILVNTNVDMVNDAAALVLGNTIAAAITVVAELSTPVPGVDGAVGLGVGGGINAAIQTAARVTDTTVENGVSMSIYNVDTGALGAGREDAFILAHDAGSAIEFNGLGPTSLVTRLIGVMKEHPLAERFPESGRLLPNLRPVENPIEFLRFATDPAHNGGSEEVKRNVDRRQLDEGTSPWDLAANSYVPAQRGTLEKPWLSIRSRAVDATPPEIYLAQAVQTVLMQSDTVPFSYEPLSEGILPNGTRTQTVASAGDTWTASQLLAEAVAKSPTFLDTNGQTHDIATYLFNRGARDMHLNFGLKSLGDMIDAAYHPESGERGYVQTAEDLAHRQNFTRSNVYGSSGSVSIVTKTYEIIRNGELLAEPVARESEHSWSYARNGNSAKDTVGFILGELRPKEKILGAAERTDGIVVATASAPSEASAPKPGFSAADSRRMGDHLYEIVARSTRQDVREMLASALRTGDTSRLVEATNPRIGAAVRSFYGSSASTADVIAGVYGASERAAASPRPDGQTLPRASDERGAVDRASAGQSARAGIPPDALAASRAGSAPSI